EDLRAPSHAVARAAHLPLPGRPRASPSPPPESFRPPRRRLCEAPGDRLPRPPLRLREAPGAAPRRTVLPAPAPSRDRGRGAARGTPGRPRSGEPGAPAGVLAQPHPLALPARGAGLPGARLGDLRARRAHPRRVDPRKPLPRPL